ncbi:fibronectin type III domain-containing protein [Candidatus Peregrinibacteria bacterium]|nr:fibronectin type III domain-containing protein [Candidatus Peregrinibacteria bacterium]
MASRDLTQWLIRGGLILTVYISIVPRSALAAPEGARLILRPHCEESSGESESSECPLFSIRNPLTRETPIFKKDDLLDMDLVLIQDNGLPINRIRTWLAYDPNILDGDLLETNTDFPDTAPGEHDFAPSEGYIKIDISVSGTNEKQDTEIILARIRMRVRQSTVPSTPISFYDVAQGTDGHTMVISGEGTDARNILFPELGSLLVRMENAQSSSSPTVADHPPIPPIAKQTNISPPQPTVLPKTLPTAARPNPPTPVTPFTLLQIQNIGVTTEEVNIFLGWDPLSTPDLIGYNVYYASRSGEYIHKRSLDATATSTTVRDLPIGVKYFFAIRGVNRAQQESAFSKEVAVTTGNPASSTAPLAASMIPRTPPALRTPLHSTTVPGQTGISSWLGAMMIGVALIGTILAIRKQLLLS